MISSEVAEDICVSLSYNEEGGIMDLINFEEGEGEGDGDIGELCPYEGGEGMDGDGGNMEGFGVVLGQSAYKTLKDGRKVKRAVTWKCECASLPDTRRRIGGTRLPRELEGEPIATKKSKKCGCETGMYASLKEHGKWEIVRRELKHEPHKVSPSKSMLVTKYRLEDLEKMWYVRRKLHFGDDVGMPAATMHKWLASERNEVENMPFTKKDVSNLISREKKLKLKDGDTNSMMNYFQMMQKNNKNFYHIHRVDANGVLQDVFWVDARSKTAYEDFGDVVWLFSTWLDVVGGKPPVAILTDQDPAMRKALKAVMPQTRHRWCLWYITEKFGSKLGKCRGYAEFKNELENIIYDSLFLEEFELRLCDFAEKYVAAMEQRIQSERLADANSAVYHRGLVTDFRIEEIFRNFYTDAKFVEVHRECKRMMCCNGSTMREIS
ncbi:protein FAR-RED IMPAIRED RESPONSE 1-like [Chenopodium quinoa]|uniref:protein FAR-RED IMPAIRED RESPONSE 1-like n=1 Tax=Chenopodium quinoa TaxID=63459 RepID=UPI000B788BD1|nr:protein FAR-RED IMPAIRED RESPONSE 1-like [Chenopodium quinoa]